MEADKSYVTMEQHICVVCTEAFDTDTVLLHQRLKPVFAPKTITGWGLCPVHQKMKDEGYIAIVGVKGSNLYGNPNPDEVDRTGDIIHIKAEAWDKVFNTTPPPPKGVCWMDEEGIAKLKTLKGPSDESQT